MIYHLALAGEWEAGRVEGAYRRSTLGKSLAEVGFIHCSHADQVQMIADLVYAARDDVVLLAIDPSLVGAEIRVENLDGGAQQFPHIYGPLPIDAVIRADHVELHDGRLDVAARLR